MPAPTNKPPVFGLTEAQVKRIAQSVLAYELTLRGSKPQRGRWGSVRTPQGQYAKVTTAISAKTGTTLGQGKITLYDRDGAEKTLSTTETDLDCYNDTSQTIAVNSDITVMWTNGAWEAVVWECPP